MLTAFYFRSWLDSACLWFVLGVLVGVVLTTLTCLVVCESIEQECKHNIIPTKKRGYRKGYVSPGW